MIEKDVKVKIYAKSKEHGFNLHKEISFEDYCKEKGYVICKWHKVTDGDLPTEDMKDYLCYFTFNKSDWYDIYTYHNNMFCVFDCESGEWVAREVIAWTELPKYKGSLYEN